MYDTQEARDTDRLKGRPVGVVQYNPYGDLSTIGPDEDRLMNNSNGSLIAVNYKAKGCGVRRNQRGAEACRICPSLQLVQVPTAHGKADLTIYRNASKRVLDILGKDGVICERASVDECYLDLSEECHRRLQECGGVLPYLFYNAVSLDDHHVYGPNGELSSAITWFQRRPEEWEAGELLLAFGSLVVKELRDEVYSKLGYTCSAGIAHSRLLAKLCSGLHKPAQQTIVPGNAICQLLAPLPISKLRGLGGQFGAQVMRDLNIETVGELAECSVNKLTNLYGEKDGRWLHSLARGIDDGEVSSRRTPKSISCGKTFRGNTSLTSFDLVDKWMKELAGELESRITLDKDDNARIPNSMTVSIYMPGLHTSRSCHLRQTTAKIMAEDGMALVKKVIKEQGKTSWKITDIYMGVSNFVPLQSNSIMDFFGSKDGIAKTGQKLPNRRSLTAASIEKPLDASKEKKIITITNAMVEEDEPPRQQQVKPALDFSGNVAADCGQVSSRKKKPIFETHSSIDANVLAELPLSIQKELKTQMEMEAMVSKFQRGPHCDAGQKHYMQSDQSISLKQKTKVKSGTNSKSISRHQNATLTMNDFVTRKKPKQ